LELSDARLLLEQAQLNRATAGRALQLARLRAALLPELPLGTASSAQFGSSGSAGQLPVRADVGALVGGSASAGATR
jgi:hypothetical protein